MENTQQKKGEKKLILKVKLCSISMRAFLANIASYILCDLRGLAPTHNETRVWFHCIHSNTENEGSMTFFT
jgi:hypothetical protein